MLYIKLLDSRGNIIWANDDLKRKHEKLLDYTVDEDRQKFHDIFSRCVVDGEVAEVVCRHNCSDPPVWAKHTFFPMQYGIIACVAASRVLPGSYPEIQDAEKEVLSLLAQDSPIQAIARALERSPSTIDSRLRSIKSKLGTDTLHGLVAKAIACNVIPADSASP